ncbi:hypothetical protein ACFQZC_15285 [Streptacidiphilus monticola]
MSSKRRTGKSRPRSAPPPVGRAPRSSTAEAAESERLALEFPHEREELLVQAARSGLRPASTFAPSSCTTTCLLVSLQSGR